MPTRFGYYRDLTMTFVLGVLVAVFVAILWVQAADREEAEALMVAAAAAEQISATTDLDELAAKFDVTIVWTDDDRNCGAGCYRRSTPDVIYVKPGYPPEVARHIVLHEIGHAMHHRLGLPSSEAEADRFAASMEWATEDR